MTQAGGGAAPALRMRHRHGAVSGGGWGGREGSNGCGGRLGLGAGLRAPGRAVKGLGGSSGAGSSFCARPDGCWQGEAARWAFPVSASPLLGPLGPSGRSCRGEIVRSPSPVSVNSE